MSEMSVDAGIFFTCIDRYSGLLASMRRTYGDELRETDIATALCYRRLT